MNKLPSILFCVLTLATLTALSQKSSKVDFAKKIASAEPEALPQSPAETGRPSSDARDANLKGCVRSVFSFNLEGTKRIPEEEDHYDESGNLVKHVYFQQGYPESVTVYGYVDGMRVFRSANVTYTGGEKGGGSGGLRIVARAEDNIQDKTALKDTRYGLRLVHKYDDKNRLIEKRTYQNTGEIWKSQTFQYNDTGRVVRHLGPLGGEMTKTTEILDAAGNAVEQFLHGPIEEKPIKHVIKYKFDGQGNWTTASTYQETTAGNRSVLKLRWTTVRTITYYP